MRHYYTVSVLLYNIFLLTSCNSSTISVEDTVQVPQTQFALAEIQAAISELEEDEKLKNFQIELRLGEVEEELGEEGFRIRTYDKRVEVIGGAAAGAMYGGLELAEQIRLYGPEGIKPVERKPYLDRRGTKFNIPLDARTPSYTDASDVAQHNLPEMWSMDFWQAYLDGLARHRYNYVSLWNLHPFPSLVKVPGYEDVALADVHRSTVEWEEHYHLHGTGLDAPEILAKPEIVKRMTIQEKIEFWRAVMRYAKERNIDFYFITWNIFTNGTDGKYGITDAIDNEVTKDYFRKSVTQCFLTYSDLEGIGLTTGENMHGQPFEAKENWAYDTYAEGVLEAARLLPERKITFIHRQHQTGAKDIARKFKTLVDHPNIDFLFCFKYAKAHAFSTTEQPYHHGFVKDIQGMKTIWGLRNDSNYHFRWGAPDFVREFIGNLPHEVAAGIYYGSDQWVWGRDFLSKASSGQLDIEKHWYHWLLWGRLAYDPELSNIRLIALLGDRFPEVDGERLFTAWQEASMVYPTITAFHWGPVDFKWYPEACKSRPGPARNETGFHDVNRFISLPPHPNSGFQSIPDFVVNGSADSLLNPLQVAGKMSEYALSAEKLLGEIGPVDDPELRAILADIKTMALLGHYYSNKIRGAAFVASYRATGKEHDRKEAIGTLSSAKGSWQHYVNSAKEQYHNPLWTNRVGHVDWDQISEWVEEDIQIARKSKPGIDPTLAH
ncbi:MAG: carbohydrate-binding family 6 protein [Bacteroidota bacterium]